ncbi:MAG: phosphoribosylamine--glycine ligase [Chloroflexi bacterium]|nr:phosphoribosylamine--glycine ligase [Chloroflexota bacterium]
MHVLIVGNGGREHALAWALARSPLVDNLTIAPGNAGTDSLGENVAIAADDIPALLRLAQERHVDLTVVGPEAPLAAGIVDTFHEAGLKIFGPTRAAAQLESSKAFAKAFMKQHGIPTAEYSAFEDYTTALRYLADARPPIVLKADGLAAGKGVIIAEYRVEAQTALRRMMIEGEFGHASDRVVIEEYLSGREVSLLAFCDGQTVVAMPPARDHKRAFDGDEGPNTGGMGVYTPPPDVGQALADEIVRRVLKPTIFGMAAKGTPYVGVLYAGLMLTPYGFKTLEFNCRFGDPEAQALIPMLETDLAEIMLACVEGRLHEIDVHWRQGASAAVVLAADGYPGSYRKGVPIEGLDSGSGTEDSVSVFHAGTERKNGQILTSGGRVLAVSARGDDLPSALRRAYARVQNIHFDGMHYRRDIGQTADDEDAFDAEG